MTARARDWRISTEEGVSLESEELTDLVALHHQRLVATWREFTPAQWDHHSRNTEWNVHRTVRHMADAVERGALAVLGEPMLDEAGFDPRATPDAWLVRSEGEAPKATIERFAAASTRFQTRVRDRVASGDDGHDRTVYGTAHWTVNVVHVLWDSWLHERDIMLPLGQAAPSSTDEQRLVGLYGLLMALVPSMIAGQSISTTVQLVGVDNRTIAVRCDAGSIVSAEAPGVEVAAAGSAEAAIDALAGRGDSVADVLPGAPEELGFLAAFFNSK